MQRAYAATGAATGLGLGYVLCLAELAAALHLRWISATLRSLLADYGRGTHFPAQQATAAAEPPTPSQACAPYAVMDAGALSAGA